MSTNTLVSDIIAEHDARQRTQQTRTPKEVHARMIEMTNAANGLRYEVARLGDIERKLKAVHERMGPLILRAAELNDLICERVSQASQPWADSRIHESEELVQKVQQLERENAEQCVLLGKGGERECALLGKVERLERENAALREKNAEWREMIREAVFDNNDILYWIRGARRVLLGEVEKDHAARKKAQP